MIIELTGGELKIFQDYSNSAEHKKISILEFPGGLVVKDAVVTIVAQVWFLAWEFPHAKSTAKKKKKKKRKYNMYNNDLIYT